MTVTSTFLSTFVSTINEVSVQSCIGIAQFSIIPAVAAALGVPAVAAKTLTAACSRKRRGINIEEIKALEAIAPSQVEP